LPSCVSGLKTTGEQRACVDAFRREPWVLPVDVHETTKDVIVTSSIRLADPRRLTVSILGNRLTIRGERQKEDAYLDEDCNGYDREYSALQRTALPPGGVAAKDLQATYRNGVV
jgi:HSP20 family molecular chaperone IbpA